MDSIPDSALSIVRTLELNDSDNPAIASEAHYINGVSRLKLWDFKGAVRELLFAEKFANEAKAYGQLGDARMAICFTSFNISHIPLQGRCCKTRAMTLKESLE